jgi:hypothetical protein
MNGGGDGDDIQVVYSIREAVKISVQIAEILHAGYVSADDALLDFLAVNWAYECTVHGEPLITHEENMNKLKVKMEYR